MITSGPFFPSHNQEHHHHRLNKYRGTIRYINFSRINNQNANRPEAQPHIYNNNHSRREYVFNYLDVSTRMLRRVVPFGHIERSKNRTSTNKLPKKYRTFNLIDDKNVLRGKIYYI